MKISDYRVFVSDQGDGIIAFLYNNVVSSVIIPYTNDIGIDIFNRYYNQLEYFKYRFDAIANWIVRDLRKEGYIFKSLQDHPSIYVPVYYNKEAELAEKEKFQWFYYEQELIRKKLLDTSLVNEY